MTTAIIPIADVERMANSIAKSGLFGMKTIDQAAALMLIAQAEGRHPASAAQDYHIIQGRPALKADAMMARFLAAGGKCEWHRYEATVVDATFSHPQGGSIRLAWTIEDAKRIGLAGKDNWKHYPRAMLRARVISEGIRTVFPGVAVGMYTPEEVQDFDLPVPKTVETVPAARQEAPVLMDKLTLEQASQQLADHGDKPGFRELAQDLATRLTAEDAEEFRGIALQIHNAIKQRRASERLKAATVAAEAAVEAQ